MYKLEMSNLSYFQHALIFYMLQRLINQLHIQGNTDPNVVKELSKDNQGLNALSYGRLDFLSRTISDSFTFTL